MKKSGQASVEYILLLVVLFPVILSLMGWLKTHIVVALDKSLRHELSCNVRYAYSCRDLEESQEVKYELMPNVTGEPPYMYQAYVKSRHPLSSVERGW
ncbi:MAG: hypothetical protein JXA66_01560 [Oligoflexia bacterium]|nr:hypothetical protein [Oligoflexia bacterium]